MRRLSPATDGLEAQLYDPDTGLYGRTVFGILGDELVEQARRYGAPLSLSVYRMDWLAGGAPGDPETVKEVLHYIGFLIVENLRRCDIAAHLGQGVFGVLLPHTPLEVAQAVTARLCKTIIGSPVVLRSGDQMQMLASAGVAGFAGQQRLADLLQAANQALGRPPRRLHRRLAVPKP